MAQPDQHQAAVEAARRKDRPVRLIIAALIGVGVLVFIVIIGQVFDSNVSQPAPIVKGPDYNEVPNSTVANKSADAKTPVVAPPEPTSPTTAASASGDAHTVTAHQQRLAALPEKQESAEMKIAIEREAIQRTIQEYGVEGVPEDEHERVNRLIQEKGSIDAAIKEEEQEGGSEPSAPTAVQTLAHHQIGATFSIGYWTYRCDSMRWSQMLGNGSSEMGRPDAAFAVIRLMMRNDDDSASIIPPFRLVDSGGREYEPSPKAVLQKDALDLTRQVDAKASAVGSVIFDVPQERTYFLKVSGGMMSSEAALVDLAPLSQTQH